MYCKICKLERRHSNILLSHPRFSPLLTFCMSVTSSAIQCAALRICLILIFYAGGFPCDNFAGAICNLQFAHGPLPSRDSATVFRVVAQYKFDRYGCDEGSPAERRSQRFYDAIESQTYDGYTMMILITELRKQQN